MGSLRSLGLVFTALAPVVSSGCSSAGGAGEEPAGTVRSPIAYGSLDTTHTAVVAVLAPVTSQEFEECTGSVVGVSGGTGTVLTAAHCCNTYVPTVIVMATDYSPGERYVSGGTPVPPAYPVLASSVYYDAQYGADGDADHDFCMLEFSGASAATPTLALPSTNDGSTNDGLSLGSAIEHVGYGQIDDGGFNSDRRSGIDSVDQELTPLILQFSQGGPTDIPGTCDGDSGGPSLFPATAAQAQQVVVGVQSRGTAAPCAQITVGIASRVSSAMGTGGFIASYLAGKPIGVQAAPQAEAGAPDGGGSGGTQPVPAVSGRGMLVAFALGLLAVGAGQTGAARAWPRGPRPRRQRRSCSTRRTS